jgi:hypothetical protein
MYLRVVTCPECIEKAKAFLVPAEKDLQGAKFFEFKTPKIPTYVLARNTKAMVTKPWRQELWTTHQTKTRIAIWRPKHNIQPHCYSTNTKDQTKPHIYPLKISNNDNQRSHPIEYCKATEQITLYGPGFEAHIKENESLIKREKDEYEQRLKELARKEQLQKQLRYFGLFTIDDPQNFEYPPETKEEEIYLVLTPKQAEKIIGLLKCENIDPQK